MTQILIHIHEERGDDHGEVDCAFYGGVLTPDGKVIFVPRNSDYVGIYDPDTDTYTRGDAVVF